MLSMSYMASERPIVPYVLVELVCSVSRLMSPMACLIYELIDMT